ncbi:MAG TPA: PIN domain-containing protein [Thermoanaerobaculia bacterium]|nr:PIN domain-containing protein [Thermoanaerobaculia bacterium]
MTTFVDTSAVYALLDARDRNHRRAAATLRELLDRDEPLVTTNYVIVELLSLVQHRLGMAALRAANDDILAIIATRWIDEEIHARAVASLLAARQRNLSIVDCVSFEMMRSRGLRAAFAFDSDFARQGFSTRP